MQISDPLNRWIAAGIAGLAGLGALLVFFVVVEPAAETWSAGAIALAGGFVAVLMGFVLLALGKTGPLVTSRDTDRVMGARYRELRRRLRPFGLLLALAILAYGVHAAWTLSGSG